MKASYADGMPGCRKYAVAVIAAVLLCASAAGAADKVVVGAVGSPSGTLWPYLIAEAKGFVAAADIDADIVYIPTGAGTIMQLAAGSVDVVVSTGTAEPIHAIDRGANVAIARIGAQVTSYELLAKPSITSLAALKGHKIAYGGLADITAIYMDRLIAASGLSRTDFDIIVIGATGARLTALQSGGIDATMLLPPANFRAEETGFKPLALLMDASKEIPFTAMVVSRDWVAKNPDLARRFTGAYDKAIAWFEDAGNRDEAIDILVKVGNLDRNDVTKTYDFFRKIDFFAPGPVVSKRRLAALMQAQVEAGDISAPLPFDRLVIPALTRLAE